MRKRILSFMLGLFLVAGLVPMGVMTAFAADGEEFTVDEMKYTVVSETDKTVELSSVTENCTGNVEIPETVSKDGETYTVTGIGEKAFFKRTDITNIQMPNSITTIESAAFAGCHNLSNVIIPERLTSIGQEVFLECKSFTEITIPDGVTNIGYGAFAYCVNLGSITIPSSVTSIGARAFSNCEKFESITIPGTVTSMGEAIFQDCDSLKTAIISDGVVSIPRTMFSNCKKFTDIVIPDSVTSIGDRVFVRCALTEMTIPDGVTTIGEGAFGLCKNLTTITIPGSITSLGENVFGECEKLTNICVPCDFDKGVFVNTAITVNESDSNSYEVSITNAEPVKGTFTYSHTFDKEVATEDYLKSSADCTNAAVYYKSCSCGTSSEGTQEAPTFTKGTANGHSYVHHDKVDATVKTEGKAEHFTCENCNLLFDKDKNVVDAKDLVIAKIGDSSTTEGEKAETVETGDDSNMWMWIALLVISCGGVSGVTIYGRKKKQ